MYEQDRRQGKTRPHIQTGAEETQVKMTGADGTREVKQNSIHKESGFQSKTGEKKHKKQKEPRKIPNTT